MARAPENTLAAVRGALASGVDLIEVDVRVTADSQAVLLHDRDLSTTTNGRGAVDEHTYGELRGFDAGSWFGDEFAGEPVPLLGDVLDAVAGRVRLNVDLKTASAIPVVADLLRASGRSGDVVISGCPADWVTAVRAAGPDLAVLLNLNRAQKLLARLRCRWAMRRWVTSQARVTAVAAVNVAHDLVDRRLVEALATEGRAVWAFTVDDPERARALAAIGVAAITTNDPATMVAAFGGQGRGGDGGGAPGTA